EPFSIPSGSMIPTLLVGDYLFVSKYSYGYSRFSFPFSAIPFKGRILGSEPKRGDVAVFKKPREERTDFIKRIVGMPGDRIQVRSGVLFVNGTPVKRDRIADYVYADRYRQGRVDTYMETLPNSAAHVIIEIEGDRGSSDNTEEFAVPAGHYFMMGDNRDNSSDSRADVGFVPFENLIGRAEFVFFSTDGTAALWEVWKWPFAIRYGRLLHGIR
ncbi:MAG: signal peptidase I, partial [Alphaproteobacteria bacterium]|nr:signal peptidase I [Alphaproteobacteria bacterium]